MAITKPPVLPPWAEAGDKVQPSNAEIQAGWPLSSIPPSRQRFNWLLNFLANGIRYFSRRGLPDYDAAETYMTGDRIIGDDGKTYRSLIDNNIGQTPSAQPTKWERWGFTFSEFAASVTTPPQFDNDTSLATTAFVQRALGNMRGGVSYVGNGNTIAASDVGGFVLYRQTGTGQTLYLPSAGAVPAGSVICISGYGPYAFTLAAQGGQDIICRGGTATSLSMLGSDSIILVSESGTRWNVIGGSYESTKSPRFASSLASSGWKRYPDPSSPTGYLIEQWGAASIATANTWQATSYPIAFPNALMQIVASTASTGSYGGAQSNSLNQCNLFANNAGAVVSYRAIGY